MKQIVFNKDFSTLRKAYAEVKTFIEKESGEKVISLDTKIDNDLGLAGDDNLELLEKFVAKYQLDTTGFDYSKHFLSEGELFHPLAALLSLLLLPVVVLFWIIKLVSFGKVNLLKRDLFTDPDSQTSDLTFGDMLTWYLAGKYCVRSEVRFQLAMSVNPINAPKTTTI